MWEADLAQPMVLYDAVVGLQARKAIAAMRADGYLFLLDRATGKPLMPVEERRVPRDKLGKTAPTQPFPVGADRVLLDCEDWEERIDSVRVHRRMLLHPGPMRGPSPTPRPHLIGGTHRWSCRLLPAAMCRRSNR